MHFINVCAFFGLLFACLIDLARDRGVKVVCGSASDTRTNTVAGMRWAKKNIRI